MKAEDALERMRNGLGGRYYKTREQVERRIGQIIGVNITGLIDVTVTTRNGKLDSHLAAQPGRDHHGRVASTGSTRSRRTSPAGSPPARCCGSTRTSRSSSVATAI